MDLDEMKLAWTQMSDQLEQQKRLTNDLILQMTHEKSTSRLNRIITAETIGVVVTVVGLILVGMNFNKLENWLEITGGIGTLVILVLGIALGIRIISQANKVDLINQTYSETLEHFNRFKKTLGFYKRLGIVVNIVSPFFVIPAVLGMFTDQDILKDPSGLGVGLITAIVVIPAVLFLIIRFYKRNVSGVNQALKNYEDEINH